MKSYTKSILVIFMFTLVVILIGIMIFYNPKEKAIIASISNENIYLNTVNYQIGTDNCYGDNEATPKTTVIELTNKFLEKAVLLSAFNLKPTMDDLKNKSATIDKNSKDSNILNCVKSIFEGNTNDYLNLFVAPTLINPRLHDEFASSADIHREEKNKIINIQDYLKNGSKLESLEGYRKFEIPKQTEAPENLQNTSFNATNPLIDKVLKNMKPGDTWPNIIEDDSGYQIARLLKENPDKYECDGVFIAKKSFDPWFRDYVLNNIKIEIKDQQLLEQIRQDYPDLWWLEIVNK